MMNRERVCKTLTLTSGCTLLLAMGCAGGAQDPELVRRTQQAVTFPTSWTPLAQAGADLTDPIDDGGTSSREIVGTPNPAVYVSADATHFMVRLRLDDDPRQGPGVAPFGWGVLFDLDNDLNDYELSLLVDGTGNPRRIVLAQNTLQRSLGDPSDAAEVELSSVPIDLTVGGNLQVSEAGTNTNGDLDYFLDFATPLSELAKGGVGLSSALRVIAGTSNSANSLSVDLAGTGVAPGIDTLKLAASDPTFLDGSSADLDRDQILDTDDLDDDNDGIPDLAENPLGIVPDGDADADRIPNWRDASNRGDGNPAGCSDAASDGVCDTVIALFDADGDGVPNDRDLDSDDDGIVDAIEAGHAAPDSDKNGVLNGAHGSNGLADAVETAIDSGAIKYIVLDTDDDGTWDFLDLDSDGDAVKDLHETSLGALDTDLDGRIDVGDDLDGDGLRDAADNDTAQPGFPKAVLPDADSDGIPSPYDAAEGGSGSGDSDGDASSDSAECPSVWPCADSNADGTPDYMSALADQDGDGVYDSADVDADNDGVPNLLETTADSDGDLIPNWLDLDSDNDGIPDLLEAKAGSLDANGDGRVDVATDTDHDGMADTAEQEPSNAALYTPKFVMPDTDADGKLDSVDLDSDGDGLSDLIEAHGEDLDANGVVDSTQDPNRNGLAAVYDPGESGTRLTPPDTDSDGKRDFQDADDDGDGILSRFEESDPNHDGRPSDARHTDSDGVPDYLDPDDDGDGIPTANESADPNADGDPSDAIDSDHDGIVDALDATQDAQGSAGAAGFAGQSNDPGPIAGAAGAPQGAGGSVILPAAGGTSASGGVQGLGGTLTLGGTPGAGGALALGGTPGAGGAQSGGVTSGVAGGQATGGTHASSGGASSAAGGQPATGGSPIGSGGAQVGGAIGTAGGAAPVGGAAPSGGAEHHPILGDAIEGGGLDCRIHATRPLHRKSGLIIAMLLGLGRLRRRRGR